MTYTINYIRTEGIQGEIIELIYNLEFSLGIEAYYLLHFFESFLLFPINQQKELPLPAVLAAIVHHPDAQYTLAEHLLLNLFEEFES